MRLWHQDLIPILPRQQLLGQHRECCALRGKGWGKKHATVNYVFDYPKYRLFQYHALVMHEMFNRGYKVSQEWLNPDYCGKLLGYHEVETNKTYGDLIYPEHDGEYLIECINNLRDKGVNI